jgi:hypothetical protein
MKSNTDTHENPQSTYYPDSEGWWWIQDINKELIPVMVEKRGKDLSLSVCIPRSSAHYSTWWKSLKSIKGQWFGKVSIPAIKP